MSVTVPPTTAAKLIGMRYRDGDRPVRRAHDITPGIAIATIGVLLRNAEHVAVGTTIRASRPRSPRGSPRIRAPTHAAAVSITRVRAAAAATT